MPLLTVDADGLASFVLCMEHSPILSCSSPSPRDSRKGQEAGGDAELTWDSAADPVGKFWGKTLDERRESCLCVPIPC